MGDMLYMAGGGRITRLHGPFVSDAEVDTVARFLRSQGKPDYVPDVTAMAEEDEDEGFGGGGGDGEGADLYDQAVAIVARDRKASTSYIQRRLQIGYNRAASLVERMEKEGVVSVANHAGKREVLVSPAP
jgi:S-DNA-T family DNA segregation ATPase FtsK/SpoIIIE